MRRLARSALLPYAPEAMFALVNDIERYPEYLKWCRSAEILETRENEVVAALTLAGGGLRESLVTRNCAEPSAGEREGLAPRKKEPDHRIVLTLVEGPFRHFEGIWTFTPVGAGCRIDLTLEFELKSGFLSVLGAPFLNRAADALVDAFSRRARDVLGPGR